MKMIPWGDGLTHGHAHTKSFLTSKKILIRLIVFTFHPSYIPSRDCSKSGIEDRNPSFLLLVLFGDVLEDIALFGSCVVGLGQLVSGGLLLASCLRIVYNIIHHINDIWRFFLKIDHSIHGIILVLHDMWSSITKEPRSRLQVQHVSGWLDFLWIPCNHFKVKCSEDHVSNGR